MNAPLGNRYPLAFKLYPYRRSADQDTEAPVRHPIVIVGGGPVGLALAMDLGKRGTSALVLDDHEGVGQGSRAICFAKRTLEIMHRLDAGKAMLAKGVVWQKGRVFRDRDEVFNFDLLPEDGHRCPAFINLSQIHFERFQMDAIDASDHPIEVRGKNRVDDVIDRGDHVLLDIMTPDGSYQIEADYLIACDGARSPIRDMMGLGFEGRVFEDNFLIADVKMTADFPTERWFWFEPWFKSGDSALLHKQPDDVWRIDFQLGWDIDRETELKEENIRARVDQMLGPDVAYALDWCSIYTFQCRRMEKFRHGRVIFAGDSAHQVSPFGARGANSGVQDADNLGWKLDAVLGGAPDALLDSYDDERILAADENILNSSRATDFLTPKSAVSKLFRNAVLDLAKDHAFARPLINSGRLSIPSVYDGSPLSSENALGGPARTRPGAPCPDAPFGNGYLLDHLGDGFVLLAVNTPAPDSVAGAKALHVDTKEQGLDELVDRYLGQASTALYLIRPDQHIAARWPTFDATKVVAAIRKATGHPC
ncbi:MAG: FAD-dependent oxidoreductase [Pseudomonadota bacterium]